MATINDLYDFIETATRNRKYPPSTAQGLRAAVKLFDGELNEDERNSIDKVKDNLEQIYQGVFAKNKNFTAASLATYKSRMLKVINDYEKYGTDPTKMTNWNPKVIVRAKRSSPKTAPVSGQVATAPPAEAQPEAIPSNMHKIELALRPDAKFVLIVPRDLKASEVETLKAILTSLIVQQGDKGQSDEQES